MKYMITLFVILISCSNQIAQTIKNMPNGKYSSEGKELTKLELSKLLSTNPIAFDLYNTYLRKKRRNMRHLERGILLFLGGSVLTVRGMIGSIDHHLKHSEIYFVSGIVVAAGGLTFITISLLPKKYLLRNAVDVYNQNIPKVGMENTIQIGKTTNGIGFVYNFG